MDLGNIQYSEYTAIVEKLTTNDVVARARLDNKFQWFICHFSNDQPSKWL